MWVATHSHQVGGWRMVAARVDDLERGDLPAICAKTGEPCVGLVKDTLRVVPRWVSPLAVFADRPVLTSGAWLHASRRIEVTLPIAPGRLRVDPPIRARRVDRARVRGGRALGRVVLRRAAWSACVAFVAGLVAYLVIVYVGDQIWVGAQAEPSIATS